MSVLVSIYRSGPGAGWSPPSNVTIRLTELSRFAYHVFMTGGLSQGFEDAGAARRSAFLVRQVITLGWIALIVLVYRFAGVTGSTLAGQSAFALAAVIPLATAHRPGILRLGLTPSQESHAPVMATEMSAS
jgi:hypothetical protein